MAAHSRLDVRIALAIAMLDAQQRPAEESRRPSPVQRPESMLPPLRQAAADGDDVQCTSSDRNRYKRRIKELKAESREMQAEIDRLRASILESLVPNVLCRCFSSSNPVVPPAQPKVSFVKDEVDRFFDCVRLLSKRRRLEGSEDADDLGQRAAKVAQCILDLVADARSEQLLSLWLHQAVDFVKDSESKTGKGAVLDAMSKLMGKLVGYTGSGFDCRPCTERVLLQLAEVPSLGQKLLVQAAKELIPVAEALVHLDPFGQEGGGIAQLLENAYFLLDLVEKLVGSPLGSWASSGCIDRQVLDEFVNDFFQVKAIASGCGQMSLLLVGYADRICAQIVRQLNAIDGHGQLLNKPMERLVELSTACRAHS